MTIVAVAVGLALALLTGGQLRNLRGERLRAPSLVLLAGLLYGGAAMAGSRPVTVALSLCSYAALLTFAMINLRVVGMAIVLLGLGLNAVAILANQGMPVSREAVVAADVAQPAELETVDLGPARQWEEPDDHLTFLGDVVPVPGLAEVVSFGDLILAAGLANVAFRLLRPLGYQPVRPPESGAGPGSRPSPAPAPRPTGERARTPEREMEEIPWR